jgi:DNA-binding NarL/FixJ family response regulator
VAVVRVVHADPHALMRSAVRRTLEGTGFELVGEAATGAALVPLVARSRPGLVLLELRLPQRDGLSCLRLLRAGYPRLPLIVLADSEPSGVESALQTGATGFISKHTEPAELAPALRTILAGEQHVFARPNPDNASTRARQLGLTSRELEILTAIAHGQTNKTIAAVLGLSEQTIRYHLTNLYRKLGVHNRTAASAYAIEHALLDNPTLTAPTPDDHT